MLEEWQAEDVDNLPAWLLLGAQRMPAATAIRTLYGPKLCDERALDYATLADTACAIATRLRSSTQCGDRVLLTHAAGVDFLPAFFGCLFAGVVAVPVSVGRRGGALDTLTNIAADAEPRLALCTADALDSLTSRFATCPDLARLPLLATDTLDAAQVGSLAKHPIDPQTLALLQYTSGSTGRPKGVRILHANLWDNVCRITQAVGSVSASISWLPVFHDMGLVGGLLAPLRSGTPAVTFSPELFLQKPVRWLEVISRYPGCASAAPDFAYRLCVERVRDAQCDSLDLAEWRIAISGAEPVRADTLSAFTEKFAPYGFDARTFCPSYGLAESTLFVCGTRVNEPPESIDVDPEAFASNRITSPRADGPRRRLVSSGLVINPAKNTVQIVDRDSGIVCADREVGEIVLSSDSVSPGYWRERPDDDDLAFSVTPGGHATRLHTGDLGFLLNGHLFVTGRLKELIIVRGCNHYAGDIEATARASHPCLASQPGIAFGADDDERPIVIHEVARSHLSGFDEATVERALREAIADVHGIAVDTALFVRPASLPLTTSGKPRRSLCRTMFLDGQFDARRATAVRTRGAA